MTVRPRWQVNLLFGWGIAQMLIAIVLLTAALAAGFRDEFARGAYHLLLSAFAWYSAEQDRAKLNRWASEAGESP